MIVTVCTFRRSRRGEIEQGIAIGPDTSDIISIIDAEGNRVGLIHTYDCHPSDGCFNFVVKPPAVFGKPTPAVEGGTGI